MSEKDDLTFYISASLASPPSALWLFAFAHCRFALGRVATHGTRPTCWVMHRRSLSTVGPEVIVLRHLHTPYGPHERHQGTGYTRGWA